MSLYNVVVAHLGKSSQVDTWKAIQGLLAAFGILDVVHQFNCLSVRVHWEIDQRYICKCS